MTTSVVDFLQHYGVKGMKWGVRKELEGKAKQAYADFAQVGQRAIAYSHREIKPAEYNSLSSKPIRVGDSNTSFQRVVKSNQAKLRDGMVYVTRDEQDHTNYIALFPPEGSGANRQKFAATVKVSEVVISPGMKERVDTFVKTLDMDVPIPGDSSGALVKGRAFITGEADRMSEHPSVRALSNHQLGLKYYQTWAQSQHTNDTLNQAYVKTLVKKGYNAVIDDADAGMLSQTPIILFPKQSGAVITKIVPITKDDELIARANLRAPEQRNN